MKRKYSKINIVKIKIKVEVNAEVGKKVVEEEGLVIEKELFVKKKRKVEENYIKEELYVGIIVFNLQKKKKRERQIDIED